MNYVPIVVATDLEEHFSVLKRGCQYFVYIVYVQVIGVWWWVPRISLYALNIKICTHRNY